MLHWVAAVSDPLVFGTAEVLLEWFKAILALCVGCSKEPITSIVLGGGPLVGFSSRIKLSPKMSVIDVTQAPIGMHLSLIYAREVSKK